MSEQDSLKPKNASQPTASATSHSASRKKLILFRIVVVIGSIMLMCAACEVALRLRQAYRTSRLRAAMDPTLEAPGGGWAMYDPLLGYRNRPNWEDHNADGMRDRPTPPKEYFRILMLGDSIGYYGDNVDDTYPGQLETLLNNDPELVTSDVLNGGTRGYTNYQELLYLRERGLDFEPDVVGFGFCLNDLYRFLHAFDVVDGKIIASTYRFTDEAKDGVASRKAIDVIRRKSMFADWIARRFSTAAPTNRSKSGYSFDRAPDFSAAWRDDYWPQLEDQMREAAKLCRTRGIDLFVVVFPYASQYKPEYLARDRDYVLRPQRLLRSLCDRLEIPMLDLYPDLDPKIHLLSDKIHLTAEGRAAVAEHIAHFLKTTGMVPKRSK